jgi:hypothetical protein
MESHRKSFALFISTDAHSTPLQASHQSETTMFIKIKTILWMIGLFFKEIYELLTGKRKWS